MKVQEVSLSLANKLADSYINEGKEVSSFFHYSKMSDQETFKQRKADLSERSFPREELVEYLLTSHQKYGVKDKETLNNIHKLKDKDCLVVVGGQQAGLLTGPLYTIHKIISVLQLAKQQEKLLGVSVVPVFWIAGEDHDFDEVNHVHILKDKKIEKVKYPHMQVKKVPVSDIQIDRETCMSWVKKVFETYGETNFSNQLLTKVDDCLKNSKTMVDFFIQLVYMLFPNEGLIVIDSNDRDLREIEKPFMMELIEKNDALRSRVFHQQLNVKESGFGEPIELQEENAHLFYHLNGERVLLEKKENIFYGKKNQCQFTENELKEIVGEKPGKVSNNVVTRPLMQEFLLPTLAFIAGPGEIAYWSTLKKSFELFNFKMPPLVPRLMMTLVNRTVARNVKETKVPLEGTVKVGTKGYKEAWLAKQNDYEVERTFTHARDKIIKAHQPLQELATKIDPVLSSLAEKNAKILQSQLAFLQTKIEKAIHSKYEHELNKFDKIQLAVRPMDLPQERVWNIFYYLNMYGDDLGQRLNRISYSFNGKHKIITL